VMLEGMFVEGTVLLVGPSAGPSSRQNSLSPIRKQNGDSLFETDHCSVHVY
jgi:hypothetical protein